ncbi:MAG: MFS transporter, partial [Candidatus Dormiibacterota bacterium]
HFGNVGNGGALAAARTVPAGLRAQVAPIIATAFAHTFVWAVVLIALSFFSALFLLKRTAPAGLRSEAEMATADEPAA